jgi:hypothetical protein
MKIIATLLLISALVLQASSQESNSPSFKQSLLDGEVSKALKIVANNGLRADEDLQFLSGIIALALDAKDEVTVCAALEIIEGDTDAWLGVFTKDRDIYGKLIKALNGTANFDVTWDDPEYPLWLFNVRIRSATLAIYFVRLLSPENEVIEIERRIAVKISSLLASKDSRGKADLLMLLPSLKTSSFKWSRPVFIGFLLRHGDLDVRQRTLLFLRETELIDISASDVTHAIMLVSLATEINDQQITSKLDPEVVRQTSTRLSLLAANLKGIYGVKVDADVITMARKRAKLDRFDALVELLK